MTDHHHHDHSGPIAIGAAAARIVVGLLAGIGVIVLIGAVWFWPSHQHVDIPLPMQNGGGGAMHTESGSVTMQDIGPCGSPSNGKAFDDTPQPPPSAGYSCQRSMVSIESGSDKGKHTLLEVAPGPGQPDLHAGDHVRLVTQNDPTGTPMYSFDDFARGLPLTLIAIVFVVVIVVVARWRGLRAVLGLGFAFLVLMFFLLPALLDGKPAVPVALIAGALILYAVLYLAHGVNLRTSSALLGTLSAMVLAAILSWAALELTHVTGLSEEQNTNVATYLQHVSITGLLLAGFIIGSLGVLNDVTITQASAAFELAAIDEEASRREIFGAAMRVGRDHIASTVYTLVLAYAGGALPLLLLFSVAGRSIRDVLTGDAVAIEIARSAVGGICLALSVPLTTAIAVLLARPFRTAATAKDDARTAGPDPRPRRTRPNPGRARSADSGEADPSRRPVRTGNRSTAASFDNLDAPGIRRERPPGRRVRPGNGGADPRADDGRPITARRGDTGYPTPPTGFAATPTDHTSYLPVPGRTPSEGTWQEPDTGSYPAQPARPRLPADPTPSGGFPAQPRFDPLSDELPAYGIPARVRRAPRSGDGSVDPYGTGSPGGSHRSPPADRPAGNGFATAAPDSSYQDTAYQGSSYQDIAYPGAAHLETAQAGNSFSAFDSADNGYPDQRGYDPRPGHDPAEPDPAPRDLPNTPGRHASDSANPIFRRGTASPTDDFDRY